MGRRSIRSFLWGVFFAAFWRSKRDSGPQPELSLAIRNGEVFDGGGGPGVRADVGIVGDRIAALGDLSRVRARQEIDARGLAIAPGFINVLSWATESLLADPRAESDVRQGVTLEIFGEGWSMGPLTPAMKREMAARQREVRFGIEWNTLGEYLEHLERRGVVPNVASLVGATTLRVHELGSEDRAPSDAELARMCELVREAMREGALGVGSALIYTPAAFATREELRALALAAAEYGGAYVTHMRSETGRLLEALEEVLDIAAATRSHTEIYHLKAAGRENWLLLGRAIERIEAARAAGLDVSANMYPYTACATGFDAAMPPWVQAGGHHAWLARLRDPEIRRRVEREMGDGNVGWENLYAAAGSAENVLLLGFRREELRPLAGRTLAEVARERGRTPEQTIVDLVLEDESRVTVAYFAMSEENVRRQILTPWIGFGSDEEALAPRGAFLESRPHPRAYGTFARLLGPYVRDARLLDLGEAIRRLTALPAANFRLRDRGLLRPGCFADVVVFDPRRIADQATFSNPHRFATGVEHVLVNGQLVLHDSRMTSARPGRFVRGPGHGARRRDASRLELPRVAG
jgi:N-acyl-D-amino-acid deacylase